MRGSCFVLLTFATSLAAAEEPFDRDWGVRGQYRVGEMAGQDAGGVPSDLYCAKDDTSFSSLVVLVTESGAKPASLSALARHLASHGVPVLVPSQESPDPRENARRLAKAQSAIPTVILALPPTAPCAKLRQCGESGGFVGEASKCYRWVAPSIGRHIVVGTGAVTYLQAIRDSECAVGEGTLLLDPTTGGSPLPDLEACGIGKTRPFPDSLVVRAGLGPCREGFDELMDGPLESAGVQVITVHGARHCDAMPGDAACAARCGAGGGAGAPAYLFRFVTAWQRGDLGAVHGWENRWLYPEADRGRVSSEYREATRIDAVTGFNISVVLGVGGRDSSVSEPVAKGVAALRPELIFGRTSTRALGLGPYLEAGWLATSNVALGGGLSVLVPLGREVALVPSLGAYGHRRDGAWKGGASVGLFFGNRVLNDISAFDAASGLRLEARGDFASDGERALVLAYQLDLTLIAAVVGFAGGF